MSNGVNPTATIKFLYNGGSPQWSVDHDPLKIPQGAQVVAWRLDPASTSGAEFVSTGPAPGRGGIVFNKPGNVWGGTVPQGNKTAYTAHETNNNPGPNPVLFGYSVFVTYTPPGKGQQVFQWDPDVSNEPPGRMM